MAGAGVARLQLLRKPPGMAVEKGSPLTSAPTFQKRSGIRKVGQSVWSACLLPLQGWWIRNRERLLFDTLECAWTLNKRVIPCAEGCAALFCDWQFE